MRKVYLWLPENRSPSGDVVKNELEALEGSAKVFRTYCKEEVRTRNYILMTSSKDVHLGIGLLSESGLLEFCRLLWHEYKAAKGAPFILFVEQKGGGGLLVTRSTDSDLGSETYHLSPAR